MDSSPRIVIIDYNMGNIRSVMNKIQRLGHEAILTYEINKIKAADKIILPGVGHFEKGMMNLKNRNLIDTLNQKVLIEKVPILGICLGMQLFCRFSEEGNTEGLGWLDADTLKFDLSDIRHKVPHMGWNTLDKRKESPLLEKLPESNQYYFVHSFHVKCNNNEDVLTTTRYGYEFVSAIQKDNIFGVQFHPEKSHEAGERIIRNFINS